MLALGRTRLASRLVCLSAVGLAAAAQGQVLYSENFDVDASANWQLNPHASTDSHANFFFDYSTVGIPSAPNSTGGTTVGMTIQANLTAVVFGGCSVSPIGLDVEALSTSGDYTLVFDLWSNTVGQFPGGGSGSTNISTYGILTSGTAANYPGVADGVWFANTPEGGSSSDYRVYSPAAPASYQAGEPVYVAPSGSRNSTDPYYIDAFTGATPPAAQTALFPQQSGTLDHGTIGMAWHEVRVVKQGDAVAWWVDDTLMGLVDIAGMVTGGGNILFGHSDINATVSADPQSADLIFTLIDNIQVLEGNPFPEPTGACCMPVGTCVTTTHIGCLGSGGLYQGDGVPCSMGLCPATAGACCLNDGTCVDGVDETGCTALGGIFNGLGTECATVPACPDVRPANDECATAEAITSLPAFVDGTTATATRSNTMGCSGVTDGSFGDVWYTVTGTGNRLIATTCPNAPAPSPATQFADFNAQVRVFTGTCGALACEAANFDAVAFGCGAEFAVSWESVLGETYYILVSGFSLETGAFQMAVFEDAIGACCFPDGTCADLTSGQCGSQGGNFGGFDFTCATVGECPNLLPPNDDCANARPISADGLDFQTIDYSTGNDSASNCAPSRQDVWWSFTPPVSGPYTIDTIGTAITGSDTVLDIFVGCGGEVLFCDDDGGPGFLSEARNLFLEAGVDYRIRVAAWGTGGNVAGDVAIFVSGVPFVQGACCMGTACSILDEITCTSSGGTYLGDFTTCGENDLALLDDGSARRELPFPFTFWGLQRDHVIVSANGYMTFADDGSDGSNNVIPDGQNPLSVVAPLWDDFNPEVAGSVHADVRGTGANQRFIAQWNGIPQFGSEPPDSFTFQAVLFPDGAIEFRYGDIVPEATAGDYSVGISNQFGGLGVSVPGSTITDGMCIRFVPNGVGGYDQLPCGNALEDITILINPCETPPPVCVCETDGNSAQVNVFDLLAYLDLWFPSAAGADIDGNPGVNVFDLLFFLDCWFPASAGAPCP